MDELIKLGSKTYVLKAPTNIGFFLLNEKDICLIDTGSSKDFAKIIDKILIDKNWNLKYIINTHSHADHIGGNKYLQDKYNCRIYSSKMESYIVNNPIFEPIMLYGASPLKDLCNHFLMAKPSACESLDNISIDGIDIIDLKGHSVEQIGVVTSDGVCFVGDAYTSEKILNKYNIQYTYDVENFLKTLDYLLNTTYKYYVPSHGEIENDIRQTLDINKKTTLNIESQILEIIDSKKSVNEILEEILKIYHISNNLIQFHLIGATLKAYIAKLVHEEKITISFENGNMLISKIQ